MRVVFMGTPDFAVPTLRAVAAAHDIVRVVTQPDRPKGRGRKMVSPPVAVVARELGLDVRQPKSVRRGPFLERLRAVEPDVAVVIALRTAATHRGARGAGARLRQRARFAAAPLAWSRADSVVGRSG